MYAVHCQPSKLSFLGASVRDCAGAAFAVEHSRSPGPPVGRSASARNSQDREGSGRAMLGFVYPDNHHEGQESHRDGFYGMFILAEHEEDLL